MTDQNNKQLDDLQRSIILAYNALLSNEIELAKQILERQIEKTYE